MTTGQRAPFEYHGNQYIFTVNQAAIEGQEKSNGIERGIISADTFIIYEAANASGIKVLLCRPSEKYVVLYSPISYAVLCNYVIMVSIS